MSKYALCAYILINLPLSFPSIIIGAMNPGHCDDVDNSGLLIADWILGHGISNLLLCFTMLVMTLYIICNRAESTKSSKRGVIGINLTMIIFNWTWFILGGVLLFRNNVDCILSGSTTVVYSLIVWCLSFPTLFANVGLITYNLD